MGLFKKILGKGVSGKQKVVRIEKSSTNWINIYIEGESYFCLYAESSNREYLVAFKDGYQTEKGRVNGSVFLIHKGTLNFAKKLPRPNDCKVSDNGRVVVNDWLDWGGELAGTAHVFNDVGDVLFQHKFNSNIGAIAISSDGRFIAVSTLSPDDAIYLIDVNNNHILWRKEHIFFGRGMELFFNPQDNELLIFSGKTRADTVPYYSLNLKGELVWKSKELVEQEKFEEQRAVALEELKEKGGDLLKAIQILEDCKKKTSNENEKRSLSLELGEVHWRIAKETNKKCGVNDECWKHLNEAYLEYCQALPWSKAKSGIAKVRRFQGRFYKKEGDFKSALDCFKEIERIEKEFGSNLLTEGDKKIIKEIIKELNSTIETEE